MNFLEALKTGKPLRRKHWGWDEQYLKPGVVGGFYNWIGDEYFLSRADMLADDWEIEGEKKWVQTHACIIIPSKHPYVIDALLKHLGLLLMINTDDMGQPIFKFERLP